jgi:hypothetical protein
VAGLGEHRRPRDIEGTHPGRCLSVRNVETPSGSGCWPVDLYGITRTARSTRRRMTTAWSPTQSRRRDCPSRLKADTSEPTSSMLLMRGSTRPPACSVGLEPLPSKRTDCRSAAGGGVHADARVATELERQESRGLTRQRLPLCPDDAALRRRPRAGSAPPLARFTPAASRRAAVSAPSTRLPVLVPSGHHADLTPSGVIQQRSEARG